MKKKIIMLRISFWVGAIADALAALRMLFPKIAVTVEYRYAMGLGASLMLGWSFLLLWADRNPLERKGVLLLTVCPVLTGILLAEIYAALQQLITFEKLVSTGVLLAALMVFFTFSYFAAKWRRT